MGVYIQLLNMLSNKTFILNGAIISVRKFSSHKLVSGRYFSCWPVSWVCHVSSTFVGGLTCSANTVEHLNLL